MDKIATRFGGGNGACVFSQKDAVPRGPISSQVGASGCAVGLGADGASSGSFLFGGIIFVTSTLYHRRTVRHALLSGRIITHVYPFLQVGLLKRFANRDPKWFPLANPTWHKSNSMPARHNARVYDVSQHNVSYSGSTRESFSTNSCGEFHERRTVQ